MTWFIVAGVLLVFMALADSVLDRLPVTTPMLYLLAGVALGPFGVGLITLDPVANADILERWRRWWSSSPSSPPASSCSTSST